MKTYQKAKVVAKNLPTGSYAAGCPEKSTGSDASHGGSGGCKSCKRTM